MEQKPKTSQNAKHRTTGSQVFLTLRQNRDCAYITYSLHPEILYFCHA